jgi:hypothetical protein
VSHPGWIFAAIATLGSVVFIVRQIRDLRRQRRNLKHWERNEPLEKTDDWD